jgi:hypothetical protein
MIGRWGQMSDSEKMTFSGKGRLHSVVCPRIVSTDVNGLFCKASEAAMARGKVTFLREGHVELNSAEL